MIDENIAIDKNNIDKNNISQNNFLITQIKLLIDQNNNSNNQMPLKNEIIKINESIKKLEKTIPIQPSQIINNQLINTIIEKEKKIDEKDQKIDELDMIIKKFYEENNMDFDDDNKNKNKNKPDENIIIVDEPNEFKEKPMNLILNNQIIQIRSSDNYVNATQLCQAGGKKLNDWTRLGMTKEIINVLELNTGIPALNLIDKKVGGNHLGTWIHPDLAIQLAQWISPTFALQVSSWIRTLFSTGKVEINLKILKEQENIIKESNLRIKLLENMVLKKHKKTIYPDKNVVYLITAKSIQANRTYIIGKTIDLTNRLDPYNKSDDFYVVYSKPFKNEKHMKLSEDMILELLDKYRECANRDRFVLPIGEDIKLFTNVFDKISNIFNELE